MYNGGHRSLFRSFGWSSGTIHQILFNFPRSFRQVSFPPRLFPGVSLLLTGLNNLLVGFSTKAAWALCTFAYSAGPGNLIELTLPSVSYIPIPQGQNPSFSKAAPTGTSCLPEGLLTLVGTRYLRLKIQI
jgi:hypothetical protein